MDQFIVTFDAEQIGVEQIQAAVKSLGFRPRLVTAGHRGSAKLLQQMTPPVQKALVLAQETEQLVLVKFSAHRCGPCQKMSKVTYSDARVKEELSRFVVVEVDIDKDLETAKALRVAGVPTFVVMSADGSVLTRVEGFKTPFEFLEIVTGHL